MSKNLLISLVVLALCSFAGSYFASFSPQKQQSDLDSCRNNVKNIAVAIKAFNADHKGAAYPRTLSELVPRYLQEIPRCPSARKDTYSESFQVFVLTDPGQITGNCFDEVKPGDTVFRIGCNGQFHRPLSDSPSLLSK